MIKQRFEASDIGREVLAVTADGEWRMYGPIEAVTADGEYVLVADSEPSLLRRFFGAEREDEWFAADRIRLIVRAEKRNP